MAARPEQLHAALMYCIDFAERMLEASGEFYPFGAALGQSGELKAIGGWNGEEHPKPIEIYKLLSDGFRQSAGAGEISGAALAVDVNIPNEYGARWPDGIRVRLESVNFSRYVYVPYQVESSRRKVELAEPFSVEVEHEFFLGIAG